LHAGDAVADNFSALKRESEHAQVMRQRHRIQTKTITQNGRSITKRKPIASIRKNPTCTAPEIAPPKPRTTIWSCAFKATSARSMMVLSDCVAATRISFAGASAVDS
jgi:hypothetical protein